MIGRLGDDHLAFAAIKLYADGALGAGTAWFPEGYPGRPDEHGQLYHEPAAYSEMVRRAHAAGLQTATHAQSPDAIAIVLDAVDAAQRAAAAARCPPPHRALRSAHRASRSHAWRDLGMVPVVQPGHHEAVRRRGDPLRRAGHGRALQPHRLVRAGGRARGALVRRAGVPPPAAPRRACRGRSADRLGHGAGRPGAARRRADRPSGAHAGRGLRRPSRGCGRLPGGRQAGGPGRAQRGSRWPSISSTLDTIGVAETWVGGVRQV